MTFDIGASRVVTVSHLPFEWLAPWYGVDEVSENCSLEAELRQESCDTHGLAGQSVTTIARRGDMDEVLFRLSDGRVAMGHLTWTQGKELDPRWPTTTLYASFEQWAEQHMVPLHAWLGDTFGD